MRQWYVKDLSQVTQVSVQTLHHYDKINLLKPSVRLPNGYRLYSEQDLLKLQQIVALKFFGFKLKQIKELLENHEMAMLEHFYAQIRLLEEKANSLLKAKETLNSIISTCTHKSIPWKMMIKSIEVYRMTEQLQNTWAGKIFNQEELTEYVDFEKNLTKRFSENERNDWSKKWDNLANEIQQNLDKDPTSSFGIELGKRAMQMVNTLYGKKHAKLRTIIWEKGYKGGLMDKEHAMQKEVIAWLDKATGAYYQQRIETILSSAKNPSAQLAAAWEELLSDMWGDSKELRENFYEKLLNNDHIDETVKKWLKEGTL